MSELFREIEEDVRAERLHQWWSKFGGTMVRISIAVVIGTALGVAWKHYQHSQSMDYTSQLLTGFEKMNVGDYKAAITAFDTAAKNGSIYADMALLQKAQAQKASEDEAGAKTTYKELAARNSDSPFAILGTLNAAKETDTPLTVKEKTPFVELQNEVRGWQLLASGKKDDAVKIFTTLYHDKNTTQLQHNRLTVALSTLAPENMMDESAKE